jgi:hypothetical protein
MRIAAVVALVGACSWATMNVPDRVPPNEVLSCAVPAAPVIDGILALAATGIAAAGILDFAHGAEFGTEAMLILTPPGLVGAGLFTASAVYGVRERSRCLRMKAQQPIRT